MSKHRRDPFCELPCVSLDSRSVPSIIMYYLDPVCTTLTLIERSWEKVHLSTGFLPKTDSKRFTFTSSSNMGLPTVPEMSLFVCVSTGGRRPGLGRVTGVLRGPGRRL